MQISFLKSTVKRSYYNLTIQKIIISPIYLNYWREALRKKAFGPKVAVSYFINQLYFNA